MASSFPPPYPEGQGIGRQGVISAVGKDKQAGPWTSAGEGNRDIGLAPKNRRCGDLPRQFSTPSGKSELWAMPVLARLFLSSNSSLFLDWTTRRQWRHRADLSRGIFSPGSSSFSFSRCSSSPRSGDLGIVSGGFRLYGRGLCPFKRGFGLISVHFALIVPLPAAAGASQHQGKDRKERDCKASFQ